jgi:hypothetical protein
MIVALTQEFVDGAVKLLVTRFIPLTPTDLEKWVVDPEEWINREENENDHWEYELRVHFFYRDSMFTLTFIIQPCAERVLLTLSSQYKEHVAALLKSTFDSVVGMEDTALGILSLTCFYLQEELR